MATITASASGGTRAWSDTNTWVGGSIPGAADDVLLTATSGAVTVSDARSCLTIDCTGYTNTLTINTGITLTVVGTKLLFVSGMTLTLGNASTSAIAFTKSTAGTVSITTGGKTVGSVTTASGLSSSSATYQLQDSFTNGATAQVTHNAGTFDFNGQTVSIGNFASSNANTRTITCGAAAITLKATSGTPWNLTATTGLTFTTGTSTLTFTGGGAIFMQSGGQTYNSVAFNGSGPSEISGAVPAVIGSLTRTGTAAQLDSLKVQVALTITTLTLNSNSGTNRLLVQTHTPGTQVTLTVGTLVCSGVIDFQDIKGAGAATWTAAASGATFLGDCLGNSGITFTTPATQTCNVTTASKNWSDATIWTSRVPLPQDDVVINGLTSGTITIDMGRIGRNIDCTGSTGGTLNVGTLTFSSFGDLTLAAGMTTAGTIPWIVQGRSAQTITTNGVTLTCGVQVQAPSGTYTVSGDITMRVFTLVTGTIVMGSGMWTLTNPGTVWTYTAGTVTPNTSTIVINDTSASAKTFAGGGRTYNNLSITGGGTGAVTITGANTFNNLQISAPKTVIFPSATTTTVTSFTTGPGGGVVLQSSTAGTQWTISCTTGLVSVDGVTLTDSSATGGATFVAGPRAVNGGNNTGWRILALLGAPYLPAKLGPKAVGATFFGPFSIRTAHIGVTQSGSCTMSMSSALTVSAAITAAGVGTLTTTSAVTASGRLTAAGTATLTATTALTAAARITAAGGSSLSTTSALSGAGAIRAAGTSALVTSSTVSSRGSPVFGGSTSCSCTLSGTVTGSIIAAGHSTMSATATMLVSAGDVLLGMLVMSSASSVAVAGTLRASGAATLHTVDGLTVLGSATSAGVSAWSMTAALTGRGTLRAAGVTSLASTTTLAASGRYGAAGITHWATSCSLGSRGALLLAGTAAMASNSTIAPAGTVLWSGRVSMAESELLFVAGSVFGRPGRLVSTTAPATLSSTVGNARLQSGVRPVGTLSSGIAKT